LAWCCSRPASKRRRSPAERLSDDKVPETIALTSDPLPRNANGKVMKRQLRDTLGA